MHTLQGFIFSTVFALNVVMAAAPGFAHAQQKFPSKPVGFVPVPTTPEDFDKIVRTDIETFKEMAQAAGLRAR